MLSGRAVCETVDMSAVSTLVSRRVVVAPVPVADRVEGKISGGTVTLAGRVNDACDTPVLSTIRGVLLADDAFVLGVLFVDDACDTSVVDAAPYRAVVASERDVPGAEAGCVLACSDAFCGGSTGSNSPSIFHTRSV